MAPVIAPFVVYSARKPPTILFQVYRVSLPTRARLGIADAGHAVTITQHSWSQKEAQLGGQTGDPGVCKDGLGPRATQRFFSVLCSVVNGRWYPIQRLSSTVGSVTCPISLELLDICIGTVLPKGPT